MSVSKPRWLSAGRGGRQQAEVAISRQGWPSAGQCGRQQAEMAVSRGMWPSEVQGDPFSPMWPSTGGVGCGHSEKTTFNSPRNTVKWMKNINWIPNRDIKKIIYLLLICSLYNNYGVYYIAFYEVYESKICVSYLITHLYIRKLKWTATVYRWW